MGDWDYINEHMGGHDEDGMPNFMSKPGFADNDDYGPEPKEPSYFNTFKDASVWAQNNIGKSIIRSPDGKGFIIKK
jgi:hypothetical protein